MTGVLVLQACPPAEVDGWLGDCMQSVRAWAAANRFDYRCLDDELFAVLPKALRPGGRITPVIASDLARLEWARGLLRRGEARAVLWLDADVLVFDPARLVLPATDHAVGREVWVQADDDGKWRSYRKVHNAALFFRGDGAGRNSFLDFYADTGRRFLEQNTGGVPAQFIGPKLLTALHNVVQLPVMEAVGMISPALALDLLGARSGALACYRRKTPAPLAAANLCRSGVGQGELSVQQVAELVRVLLAGTPLSAAAQRA